MPKTFPRVLVVSHGHPSFSLGGAEIAAYNLHKGLNRIDGAESRFLARVGYPVVRHSGTALMSLRQNGGDILYHADEYDHFLISNRNTEELERDFLRVLRDLKPDVVHFHHFIGLGLETVYAVRRALPDCVIVITFHEFLSICHHHGQMVKTGGTKLCQRASPADCNSCFPEISPARFLRREHFVRGLLEVADYFVSPSQFLVDRYVDWGLDPSRFIVIENGLDIAEPTPPRALPTKKDRRSRFAYFGQITQFKGVDVLLDAVARIPDAIWGDDAQLMIFGGNLERQPTSFQEKIEKLVGAGGKPRPLLRRLSEQRDAAADALHRLDDHPLHLVGEFAHRHSGILLPRPPDDLQQYRRHGGKDHRRRRRPALPRRLLGRPRRPDVGSSHESGALGSTPGRHQGPDQLRGMRPAAPRSLPRSCGSEGEGNTRRRPDRLRPIHIT